MTEGLAVKSGRPWKNYGTSTLADDLNEVVH
jgi:hypothetical protein